MAVPVEGDGDCLFPVFLSFPLATKPKKPVAAYESAAIAEA